MRRARNLLAALPIAAALAISGLAGGTAPASAFITSADQCGGIIYSYQYWGGEYVWEYDRAGYETPYAAYAWTRVQYFGNLLGQYNC